MPRGVRDERSMSLPSASTPRFCGVALGPYSAFTLATKPEVSLPLNPTNSGYVYPNMEGERVLSEVQNLPESSLWKGVNALKN